MGGKVELELCVHRVGLGRVVLAVILGVLCFVKAAVDAAGGQVDGFKLVEGTWQEREPRQLHIGYRSCARWQPPHDQLVIRSVGEYDLETPAVDCRNRSPSAEGKLGAEGGTLLEGRAEGAGEPLGGSARQPTRSSTPMITCRTAPAIT